MKTTKVILTSQSDVKKNAVTDFFGKYQNLELVLECINCDGCALPPQPINCGVHCTAARIDFVKNHLVCNNLNEYLFVSIENDLAKENGGYVDRAHARIELMNFAGTGVSEGISCPIHSQIGQFESQYLMHFSKNISGYHKTGGEFLEKIFGVNPKNWMLDLFNYDRKKQILQALEMAFSDLCLTIRQYKTLYDSYKVYPNFPKAGVNFKYFYSLFQNNGMNILGELLEKKYQNRTFDAILPLESRGLILGALLADKLKTTMIPVQKPGKIPGVVAKAEYEKEYGRDEIQISMDLFDELCSKNTNIDFVSYDFLIVDDLVASGGTIEAAIKILDDISKKFGFYYQTEILVLDEIAELRPKAVAKIGRNYVVFFRNVDKCYDYINEITS